MVFQAALAVVDTIEAELLKLTDFSDLYVMLDTRPKELIDTPEKMIKAINKYKKVQLPYINKLREKNRIIILEDQKSVWHDNCRAG